MKKGTSIYIRRGGTRAGTRTDWS